MRRISRFTALVIACTFLLGTTSAVVAIDDSTSVRDVTGYVIERIK